MKLEMAILAGPEAKEFLATFTTQIDRLEKLVGGLKTAALQDDAPEAADADDDDEELVTPKKKSAKKSFEDDEDEEVETEDADDDEDAEEPPKKKSKAKKLTSDDCNAAAKTLAKAIGGKAGREKVLKIMKKQFSTESVSELEPAQYADFVAAMNEALEEHKENE